MGHFDDDPLRVRLGVIGLDHERIELATFDLRDYERSVPVFIRRFGLAYKAEAADFVDRCNKKESFAVTHREGLSAMQIVAAGADAIQRGDIVQIGPAST